MNAVLTLLLAQLIDAREEAGLTQRKLAAQMNSGLAALKAWEEGRNVPGAQRLVRWADALGYDVVLLPREGNASPVTGRRHLIRWRSGKRKEGS